MKTISQAKITKGTRVILRADFNVPITKGRILDPFRIDATMPTIDALTKKGAKIIIFAHLGDDGSQTLKPVAKYLGKQVETLFTDSIDFDHIEQIISDMPRGSVLLLENIRRFEGEKTNDSKFARVLASLGDIYVNDAFSVSHRAHASVVGIPKYLPSCAGLQLVKEITHLEKAFNPKHPFLFILGGAKFETKLPLIKKFLKSADEIFIGGALANQVFKEHGFQVGESVVENKKYDLPKLTKNKKILLPTDFVLVHGDHKRTGLVTDIHKDEAMLDIGKESVQLLQEKVQTAKFILWNGPLGKLPHATKAILESIAKSKAISIIGGGDTVEVISKYKMQDKFTFVSTGGGATLDFLAKGTLPGIKALK